MAADVVVEPLVVPWAPGLLVAPRPHPDGVDDAVVQQSVEQVLRLVERRKSVEQTREDGTVRAAVADVERLISRRQRAAGS